MYEGIMFVVNVFVNAYDYQFIVWKGVTVGTKAFSNFWTAILYVEITGEHCLVIMQDTL